MKINMNFFLLGSYRNVRDHCHLGKLCDLEEACGHFESEYAVGPCAVTWFFTQLLTWPQIKIHWGAQTQNWSTFVHASDSINVFIGHIFLTWISVLYIWNFGQRHFVVFSGELVVQLSLFLFGSCIIKPLNRWNYIFFQVTCPNTAVSR